MALTSISTNIAAYGAQANIGRAQDKQVASIARLSSGNRIVRASDDAAALVTGTSLRTGVTTLKQALINTSQGSSLLSVADGGLAQITDILQRQKALAVQAGSGSLADSDRAFLDTEFQSLSSEINRLASNTKFSAVNLLNGGLSGTVAVASNSAAGAGAAAYAVGVNVGDQGGLLALDATVSEGDTININGVSIVFTNSAQGTAGGSGKVSIVKDATGAVDVSRTASNLTSFLNSSSDARLANLKFRTQASNAAGTDGLGNLNNTSAMVQYTGATNTGTATTYILRSVWGGGQLQSNYVVNVTANTNSIKVGDALARTIGNAQATLLSLSTTASGTTLAFGSATGYGSDAIYINGLGTAGATATSTGAFVVDFTTTATDTSRVYVTSTYSATDVATAVAAFLNKSTDSRVSNVRFSSRGGQIFFDTKTILAGNSVAGNGLVSTTLGAVTTAASTQITMSTVANRTIGAGISANTQDILLQNKFSAFGDVKGSILVNNDNSVLNSSLAAAAGYGPIDLSQLKDNADFIGQFSKGKIGTITAAYTGAVNTAVYQIKVGDITYSSGAATINAGSSSTVVLQGRNSAGDFQGGQFSFTFRAQPQVGTAAGQIAAQSDLDPYLKQVNDALSGISVSQSRNVNSFLSGDAVNVGGVQVGTLQGAKAVIRQSQFADVNIESFKISAPQPGSNDATIESVINGKRYVSFAGIGTRIAAGAALALQSVDNPADSLTIYLGAKGIASDGAVGLDLSTQGNADAIAASLTKAFGLNPNSAKVSFQVGSSASDNLGVRLDSVDTTRLFQGLNLSISSKAGASIASDTIDTAVKTISGLRATVGALQSRFDFAAANIQSTLQNQDAARGALLDTDVTAESTAFATAQVQLQAGIAVLAQANQLPQGLLKLIG